MDNLENESVEIIKEIEETINSLNSKVERLKEIINFSSTENENNEQDFSSAYTRLITLAANNPDDLFYNDIDNCLYIKHNSLGLLPFKVIGYNVDGKDCITLMSDIIITDMPWNSGGCNWYSSNIRIWLNSDFYNGLPICIRDIIKAVSKQTNNWQTTTLTAIDDTIWLLSKEEAEGKSNYSKEFVESYAGSWWLRSPYFSTYANAYYVGSPAGTVYNNYVTSSYGVVPCFVIE